MKKLISILAIALMSMSALAQQQYTGGVKGTVVSRTDRSPIASAHLALCQGTAVLFETVSDDQGNFLIENLPDGMYTLQMSATEYLDTQVEVTVNDGYVKNMFRLSMSPSTKLSDIDDSSFAEFDMDDSGYSDNPSILFGSNDVFESIAGYNFSAVRFRTRGYASESQVVSLAGVKMNDAITGYGPYSLWSGLNEATRSKESVMGTEVSKYGFGGYNGITNVSGDAPSMRPGLRTGVLTNSALYRLRLMLSYGSGQLDNGWSYAVNVSTRLGGNDWIRGVYYRSFGYFGSVAKQIDDAHRLSFTVMAAPGQRGAQNASTQEVYDLMGDNMYNSNWGYQNGKVRNARVKKTHEPIIFLKHDFTPSEKFSSSATLLYRFGKNGYTALDWYDSYDPRPDYYRNLPSYYYNEDKAWSRLEPEKAFWVSESWVNQDPTITHVNWDLFYQINRANRDSNFDTGDKSRSKIVQEERRTDQKDLNFAYSAQWKPSSAIQVNGGLSARLNRTEYYKILADLLGGDYFVDINNFAERDYATCEAKFQNDLDYYIDNAASPIVHQGDRYGYDYFAHVINAGGWLSTQYSAGSFSATLSAQAGISNFWREGVRRSGLFPGLDASGSEIVDGVTGETLTTYDPWTGKAITSYGDSPHLTFPEYAAKAGVAYLLGGKQRIYANAGYFNEAPKFNQSFLSPRTRNSIAPNLTTTKTFSADINYQFIGSGYNIRATGFFTDIRDMSKVMSSYDDLQNAFTNICMTGMGERHVGVEIGAKIPTPIPSLSLEGAFSWGRYIYTTNPFITQTVDNSSDILIQYEQLSMWKNHPVYARDEEGNITSTAVRAQRHYVPSTPQLAASLGLSYNINYWFLDFDVEYFDEAYLDMNPLYRTTAAISGADNDPKPEEVEYMAAQEKFDPALLLNCSIGKSWYLGDRQLGFSLNAKNLLNNTSVKTGGYEQTRLVDKDSSRYFRFDPKYFYMSGFNYMLNIYFRF